MIYLDNSATTYPKPPQVIAAVNTALRDYGFNPGRGGYRRSVLASRAVYDARKVLKEFFNAASEEAVIFTSGCTHSLNAVLKGILHQGDHVVISSFEHNAVLRPVQRLSDDGIITYSVADVTPEDDEQTIDSFRRAINGSTRLIVCTHASNVFGYRLPTERICALAHQYGILFCLDAAQTAGLFEIDMGHDGYDFVCCAGHKYLYGPMGIGVLLLGTDLPLASLIEGGTGSESENARMPSFYPDRLEAGTMNLCGVLGLSAGIRFVSRHGTEQIRRRESRLIQRLYHRMKELNNVTVYTNDALIESQAPVLAFSVNGKDSESVASYLSGHADIAVRGGLHCAPLAHRSMNTIDTGVVRASPSFFTTERDIAALLNSLRKMS